MTRAGATPIPTRGCEGIGVGAATGTDTWPPRPTTGIPAGTAATALVAAVVGAAFKVPEGRS